MTPTELFIELSNKEIKLWLDGNGLGIRAPKGSLTPELRQALKENKQYIIQMLRQQNEDPRHPELDISQIERPEHIPLAFEQERLFSISRLIPENSVHNLTHVVQLSGHLELESLKESINIIAQRHEALRTTFTLVDGVPFQRILPVKPIALPVIDWRGLNTEERDVAIETLAQQESKHSFELTKGMLWHCKLAHLEEQVYMLYLNFHHLVIDLLSVDIFISELAAHYRSHVTGKPAEVPDLKIQYADFAIWQQQLLKGDVLQDQIELWKSELLGDLPLLQLPTDRKRLALRSFNGAHEPFAIDADLWKGLQQLSREEGVTPYMTLLAAFKVLLHRYSDQSDIRLGSPSTGRTDRQLESLIGFLAYPLILRTDLSGNPSFRALLARIRETVIRAQKHQKIPFGKIMEFMPPEIKRQHNPFTVLFSFVNKQARSISLPNLTMSPLTEMTRGMTDLDLLVSIHGNDDGLSGGFEYDTDLFDLNTIRRMIGYYKTLLIGVVNDPGQGIRELPLLTKKEHTQLFNQNKVAKAYRNKRGVCIHQLFELQAENMPEKVAVVCQGATLTYSELNVRANRLAYHLQELGIDPDTLVGLCIERSLELVIAILGILKAGGAYVPLDPIYPKERIRDIATDAKLSYIVTQTSLEERFYEHPAELICLDTDWDTGKASSNKNPHTRTTDQNLAYVIYTSGSTGKPKGVLIPHSNVVNLFSATEALYDFSSDDVWTLFHSYAFDFSVWELWGALCHGGRLVVVPQKVSQAIDDFYQLLVKEQVTVLNQTPSAFRQLIQFEETLNEEHDLALRWVIFGGEALEFQGLQPWFDRHGDQKPQLVNMYGITETTVHVTYRLLKKTDLISAASNIGTAIPGLTIYLLDAYQQPVPVGTAGEMFVGGTGLAKGYLNRPELTQERFITNPLNGYSGRVYKTGDLARYLSNGELEYLGRNDHQVKIRGFRIELGEIEANLVKHRQVRETLVVARVDQHDNKQLVAYVVPEERALTEKVLRTYLNERLPNYMVPSTIMFLKSFKLTPNGKIDRGALPVPLGNRPDKKDIVAPRTTTESILVDIWVEFLGLDAVGIYDNFFELGGHSLLATQIMSRLRQAFSVELPLSSLFELRSIAELGEYIDKHRKSSNLETSSIKKVSRESRRRKQNLNPKP